MEIPILHEYPHEYPHEIPYEMVLARGRATGILRQALEDFGAALFAQRVAMQRETCQARVLRKQVP